MSTFEKNINTSPSFLATVLKRERKKANLSQSDLARAIGIGLKTIRKIEQDDDSVSLKKLNHVLNHFGLEAGPTKLVSSPKFKKGGAITKESILKSLSALLIIFREKYGVKKIGLFGSHARNEASEESDIDILFSGDTSIRDEGEMTLILEHIFNGHSVDLTKEEAIDPRLKESILEDTVYV